MIKHFKGDMNNSISENIKKRANSWQSGEISSRYYMKVEKGSLKKTEIEGKLQMKNWGSLWGNSEAILTNRVQEIQEWISHIEERTKEIDNLLKDNIMSKNLLA